MKKLVPLLVALGITIAAAQDKGEKFSGSPVIAEGAKVELLSDGFKFTEGPAVDAEGHVYFTDQPNDRILKWSAEGKLTTFLQPSGRSNGLWISKSGALLACADEKNEMWSIDIKSKKPEVIAKNYEGKLLNAPNDLWEDPSGGIYFTDPYYKRNYWKRGDSEQDGQHVYYISPDRSSMTRVTTDLKQPNGIIGTKDGKKLYVADIGDGKTYAYKINDDASLSEKTLIIDMGSDGMTLDADENLYLTGKGVTVVDTKTKKKIQHIPIDEGWTANVCFGGKDRKTLIVTAMDSLYGLEMKVRGHY